MSEALRRPERLGIMEEADEEGVVLYVANLPDGPIVVLRDTALAIWWEAVSPSGEQGLAERVADTYGLPVSEVRAAVDACVTDLVDRGALELGPVP